jgi:hypothetical protein
MSGDWRGTLWTLLVTFCIVIIRFTETLITLYIDQVSSAGQNRRCAIKIVGIPLKAQNKYWF